MNTTTEAAGVAGALRVLNGVTVDSNLSTYDWGDLQRAAATLQARLLAAELVADAAREFVRKCETGEARSVRSQAQFRAALAAYDKAGGQ